MAGPRISSPATAASSFRRLTCFPISFPRGIFAGALWDTPGCLTLPSYVLYSQSELLTSHKNTGHSTARNVARFVRIKNPKEHCTSEDLEMLKEICAKMFRVRGPWMPRRMRDAYTQEYVFSKLVVMYLVHQVGRLPTLNMICRGTKLMVTNHPDVRRLLASLLI